MMRLPMAENGGGAGCHVFWEHNRIGYWHLEPSAAGGAVGPAPEYATKAA